MAKSLTARQDLTTGNIFQKMIAFALPIMAINIFQAVYNIVDMMVIGNFIGPSGMSAVGIGGQITSIMLCITKGLDNGCSVCVGQCIGADKKDDARKIIGSHATFTVLLSIIITVVILSFSKPLLTLLDTPPESYDGAVAYLSICVGGTFFVYVYDNFYAILRSIGESVHPMYYIIITLIENTILDILFVGPLKMGPAGAALATVISQATCAFLIVRYTAKYTGLVTLKRSFFRIDKEMQKKVIKVGLPQTCQFLLTNVSFLLITALINSYGLHASAAANAANKIWSFGILPGHAMQAAVITMTAQNLPTKNYKRILQGTFCGVGIATIFGIICFTLCQFFPNEIYRLFTDDVNVAEIGTTYLKVYSVCFIVENIMFCLFGMLTGAGYTNVTLCSNIVAAIGVRYVLAYVLSNFTPLAFNGIALAYSGAPLFSAIVGLIFIASGKWKTSRVKL